MAATGRFPAHERRAMFNTNRRTASRTPGSAGDRTFHRLRMAGTVLLAATALSGCQAEPPVVADPEPAPSATPREDRRDVEQDFSRLVGIWHETNTDTPMVLTIRPDGSIQGNYGSDKYSIVGQAEPRGGDKWRIVIGSAPQPESIDDITGFQLQGNLIDDTHLSISGDDEDTVLKKGP